MNTKVTICGLDTSTLPKLTSAQSIELLKKAHGGDEKARDQFLTANLRLVLSVVQRFGGKKENMDDIFQVGCVGLIKATENFDTSLGLKFSTYAVPMIIGEIRRFLRDGAHVRISRSIRDTAYKILQTRQKLEAGGSEVSLEQVAAALEIPYRDVIYAMDAISDPVSLFDQVYHDGDETVMIMDQIADGKNIDENWINNVSLKSAIENLSARERQIVNMRFFEGKTQVEVSEEIGISQAQVSRLEKSAIKEVRKAIT